MPKGNGKSKGNRSLQSVLFGTQLCVDYSITTTIVINTIMISALLCVGGVGLFKRVQRWPYNYRYNNNDVEAQTSLYAAFTILTS